MRRSTTVAAIAALTACAAPPPVQQEALTSPAPAQWTAGQGTADDAPLPADWWTSFADPELTALVERALAQNHDLAAAGARLEQAALRSRIAGAEVWPTLDAGLTAERARRVFVGFPFGSGSGVPHTTFNSFGVSLSTSWELDLWGRVRAGESAALADAQAAAADLGAAALSLAGQTCKAYFAAVEARAQLALAEATVTTYERTQTQAEDRFARGIGQAVELRLARNNLAVAQSTRARRRDVLQAAQRQLEVLAGDYPAASVATAARLLPPPPPVPIGLPATLVARRPDLTAAERRLAAAGCRTEQARAALYPRIALTASLGTNTDDFAKLLDPDYLVWGLGGNLLQPLFAGGRLQGQAELASAQANELAARWASLTLSAYREVEANLASERWLGEQRVALAAAVDEAAAAESLAEQRYDRGVGSFLDVLEAQRRALAARTELLTLDRRRLEVRVDLLLALGGGFAQPAPTDVSSTPARS